MGRLVLCPLGALGSAAVGFGQGALTCQDDGLMPDNTITLGCMSITKPHWQTIQHISYVAHTTKTRQCLYLRQQHPSQQLSLPSHTTILRGRSAFSLATPHVDLRTTSRTRECLHNIFICGCRASTSTKTDQGRDKASKSLQTHPTHSRLSRVFGRLGVDHRYRDSRSAQHIYETLLLVAKY